MPHGASRHSAVLARPLPPKESPARTKLALKTGGQARKIPAPSVAGCFAEVFAMGRVGQIATAGLVLCGLLASVPAHADSADTWPPVPTTAAVNVPAVWQVPAPGAQFKRRRRPPYPRAHGRCVAGHPSSSARRAGRFFRSGAAAGRLSAALRFGRRLGGRPGALFTDGSAAARPQRAGDDQRRRWPGDRARLGPALSARAGSQSTLPGFAALCDVGNGLFGAGAECRRQLGELYVQQWREHV